MSGGMQWKERVAFVVCLLMLKNNKTCQHARGLISHIKKIYDLGEVGGIEMGKSFQEMIGDEMECTSGRPVCNWNRSSYVCRKAGS